MNAIKFPGKNKLMVIAALCTAVIITSCNNNDVLTFKDLHLSGSNEVPANTSTGSGTAEGNYNTKTKVITLTIKWSLGDPKDTTTMGHIHKGAVGVSGPVVIPFEGLPSGSTDQQYQFTANPLSADQEADLRAGNYYVNIHSTTFPAGELRAQLELK